MLVMKRLLLISILLMCFIKLPAPGSGALMIVEAEAVKPYEQLWKATCKVESSNNPFAIGDKNLKAHSYGIVQVRGSRLSDFYDRTGIRYTERDMFDTVKAKRVFMHYAMQFNPADIKSISCSWNAGPNWKRVKSVNKYYLKVQKELLSL